ncbi:MAG: hypothetical protein LBU32_29160 [Clostridiales bacterium]|jgi:hypothetical protein|nr:hypothetical protein [Clostridiales bacterium]
MHKKMAENIVPSINAAVNPLRDPGCANGILPEDGRESAGSARSGCAGGRRRAAGSENLSGSSAGILMKASETGGKSSESNALAEMPGSGEFKGCASAAGAARSATMEACAGGGMHWIFTAKDNNKKAFRAIKDIFGFSGAAPLFEGGCACSAVDLQLSAEEALDLALEANFPDLICFLGFMAGIQKKCRILGRTKAIRHCLNINLVRQIMKKELNALKKSSLEPLNRDRVDISRTYVKDVKLSCFFGA